MLFFVVAIALGILMFVPTGVAILTRTQLGQGQADKQALSTPEAVPREIYRAQRAA